MNVTELARRLKMDTKELLEKLPELGFDIGKRAIKVDDLLVDKIIMAVEGERKKKRIEQRDEGIKEIKLTKDKTDQEEKSAKKEILIPEQITVKDFAEVLKLPINKVIAELIKNGIMSSLNERIDFETAAIIAEDLGFLVNKLTKEKQLEQETDQGKDKIKELVEKETKDNLQLRPPVVVVMGHVDHGKTKLLDAIRETNIVAGESGGITQHIGAYQIIEKDRKITFLDTPGHEAFKSMRARGSKIADIAIIVVAADEGLKTQTLEVIDIVQKENLPFIIAINKIDKEGADIEKVKKELAELNLIPEDWGGKTICVPVSAKQKKNIPELLDMILLIADLEDFKANPNRPAIGTIIESHIDKGEGPVVTVLIQGGTLRTGDLIITGQIAGKIKAMKDYLSHELKEALPSTPVKILGLKNIPQVGDILEVTQDRKKVRETLKQNQYRKPTLPVTSKRLDEDSDSEEEEKTLNLNIILKTDVLGSQEAILEAFNKLSDPEVKLKVVKKGLGNITDADILDAQTAPAVILAFRVKIAPTAEELARDRRVEILFFDIIYKLLEEIEKRLKAMLAPAVIRTELGKVEVIAIFRKDKNEIIIGGKVKEGKVKENTKVKIIRNNETIAWADLIQLRSGKEKVSEGVKGEECGMQIKSNSVILEGDLLEIYQEKIEKRELGKV
ncbi:translation initiation factor IF-2 [Patescibacteria group bacterium]|nr:translation initiation factor IF-2 [Patescibacteria group bacterium]